MKKSTRKELRQTIKVLIALNSTMQSIISNLLPPVREPAPLLDIPEEKLEEEPPDPLRCTGCGIGTSLSTVERSGRAKVLCELVSPSFADTPLEWNGITRSYDKTSVQIDSSTTVVNAKNHPKLHCNLCGNEWFDCRAKMPEKEGA